MVIGFFMILIDTTIVSVANPRIMAGLETDINAVIWVTSAYLLAYAVPLLITGRLGDRFGPKRLYLAGLVVFTLASLWCGLSGDVQMLIAARVLQGLGAALMTPQTMAVITRIFPPDRRGAAMGLWGATAGMATLVGPILGGLLVDGLGWEWIFFINVPIGIVGFILAWRFVPSLTTHPHRFDVPGVVLSAVGLFLLVFGIQEGETYNWGTISGPVTVWGLIISGIVVLALFVGWQAVNKGEPLLPLGLFRDRNFSLANIGITTVGFTVTAFGLPLIFYYQMVRGMTPTQSALMMVPMALISGGLAPVVGRIIDRVNPKYITVHRAAAHGRGAVLEFGPHASGHPRVAVPAAQRPAGLRERGHLGSAEFHRHPQPAAAAGGGRGRRLQHHAADRRRPRQRRHRRPDAGPARGGTSGGARGTPGGPAERQSASAASSRGPA